ESLLQDEVENNIENHVDNRELITENTCNHPNCEKKFKTKKGLKNHQFVHNGKYPFKCLECSKGFTKRIRLNEHAVRMHGKKGVSTCKLCGKNLTSYRK